ncbi:hypothetical protein EDB80DRAFT_739928 [Ilyonectria destructans]|nr:hypothetical protein EDB80DRAFT_739928 [Ilyonectria destructans]
MSDSTVPYLVIVFSTRENQPQIAPGSSHWAFRWRSTVLSRQPLGHFHPPISAGADLQGECLTLASWIVNLTPSPLISHLSHIIQVPSSSALKNPTAPPLHLSTFTESSRFQTCKPRGRSQDRHARCGCHVNYPCSPLTSPPHKPGLLHRDSTPSLFLLLLSSSFSVLLCCQSSKSPLLSSEAPERPDGDGRKQSIAVSTQSYYHP